MTSLEHVFATLCCFAAASSSPSSLVSPTLLHLPEGYSKRKAIKSVMVKEEIMGEIGDG